jgi:Zn finger protein HypA/HybF involved in hydrogenase expression
MKEEIKKVPLKCDVCFEESESLTALRYGTLVCPKCKKRIDEKDRKGEQK